MFLSLKYNISGAKSQRILFFIQIHLKNSWKTPHIIVNFHLPCNNNRTTRIVSTTPDNPRTTDPYFCFLSLSTDEHPNSLFSLSVSKRRPSLFSSSRLALSKQKNNQSVLFVRKERLCFHENSLMVSTRFVLKCIYCILLVNTLAAWKVE